MNAVMQACVHCRDIDSALRFFDEMSKPDGCGVDEVTYGTLLKVLDCSVTCLKCALMVLEYIILVVRRRSNLLMAILLSSLCDLLD